VKPQLANALQNSESEDGPDCSALEGTGSTERVSVGRNIRYAGFEASRWPHVGAGGLGVESSAENGLQIDTFEVTPLEPHPLSLPVLASDRISASDPLPAAVFDERVCIRSIRVALLPCDDVYRLPGRDRLAGAPRGVPQLR
jgi:hypothetical protein